VASEFALFLSRGRENVKEKSQHNTERVGKGPPDGWDCWARAATYLWFGKHGVLDLWGGPRKEDDEKSRKYRGWGGGTVKRRQGKTLGPNIFGVKTAAKGVHRHRKNG